MDLLFTDLHLDTYRQYSTITKGGLNSRLLEQINVAHAIKAIAEERKVDRIFFLGDLINGMSESLSKTVYNAAYYIATLLSSVCPVWFIIGNHDVYRRLAILSNFASIPNVSIVEETETIDGIDLVPWEGTIPKKKSNILLGHLALNGAWVGANNAMYIGGTDPINLFGYQWIFLGHFHSRQSVDIKGANRAEYIGSVMQISFAETTQDKGVVILNDSSYEFIPIPSPQFLFKEIADQNTADLVIGEINKSKDYYKILVTHPGILLPNFDHRVSVEYNLPIENTFRLEERENEDLWDTVERFIQNTNTVIDKKKAIKFLKELI